MATNLKLYSRGYAAGKSSNTEEVVYPADVRYEFQRVDFLRGWNMGVLGRQRAKPAEPYRPDPVRSKFYGRGYRHGYANKPIKCEESGTKRKHYLDGYYAGERRRESQRQARMLQPEIRRDFDEHLEKKFAKKRREQ